MKRYIQRLLRSIGYELHRERNTFGRTNYGRFDLVEDDERAPLKRDVAAEIIGFYSKIPPFYDENTQEPLRIGGEWYQHLLDTRPTQLKLIAEKNIDAYAALLNNLFRSELISGLWNIVYFSSALKNTALPDAFVNIMNGFKYITGRKEEDLFYCGFGRPWGYRTAKGVINITDPYHGINACNMMYILDSIEFPEHTGPVLIDLGSGYGGDIEKLARWYDKPIRIICVDIPLNLTTAYAYISAGFIGDKKQLISSREQLRDLLSLPVSQREFIFMPSILVDELKTIHVNLLHNHGSFSEMDYCTIEYYLSTLVSKNLDYLLEINSNDAIASKEYHREIPSRQFPVPPTHSLISRNPVWETPLGHRYLHSLYARKMVFAPSQPAHQKWPPNFGQ